jgi:acyl carrier protein
MALFDTATAYRDPHLVPIHWDLVGLARYGYVPALLGDLMPITRRTAAAGPVTPSVLIAQLRGQSEYERQQLLLGVVRGEAAAVLGHATADAVPERRAFRDLGFDSLTAVQLRNRLAAVIGLTLPSTLLFDYPTPGELVDYLLSRIAPDKTEGQESILAALDHLERALASAEVEVQVYKQVAGRLDVVRAKWAALRGDTLAGQDDFDFESASDDEVFAALDHEIGQA